MRISLGGYEIKMFSKCVIVVCVLILHFDKSDTMDVYGPQIIKFMKTSHVTASFVILKNIPSNSKMAELLYLDYKYVSTFAYKNITITSRDAVFENVFLTLSTFQSDKAIISRIILNNNEIYDEKKVMEFKYQYAETPHVCLTSCRIIINYNESTHDKDVQNTDVSREKIIQDENKSSVREQEEDYPVIRNTTFNEIGTTNGAEEYNKYQAVDWNFILSASLIVILIILIICVIIILLKWKLQHCSHSDTTSHMNSCQSVDYVNLCKQNEPKNTIDKQNTEEKCDDNSTFYSTPTPKSLRNTNQSFYDYSYATNGSGGAFMNLENDYYPFYVNK